MSKKRGKDNGIIETYGPAFAFRFDRVKPTNHTSIAEPPPVASFKKVVQDMCVEWFAQAQKVFDDQRVPLTDQRAREIVNSKHWGDDDRIEWRLYLAAQLARNCFFLCEALAAKRRYEAITMAVATQGASTALAEFLSYEKRNPGIIGTAKRKSVQHDRVSRLRIAIESGVVAADATATDVVRWRDAPKLAANDLKAAKRQAQRDLKAARKPAK